jgi:hypothetical protein
MRFFRSWMVFALCLPLWCQVPVQVALPLPPVLDLSQAQTQALVPQDPRDPAQLEAARIAWQPIIESHVSSSALRLRLPRDERRLPILLGASQALKARNPELRLYLAFDLQAPALWSESAWGALQGGILAPEDLGSDPGRWRDQLLKAQEQMAGRPWTLWLPADPGPRASTLLGDGAKLVVPVLGSGAQLAALIPAGFTDVEGGTGDLTLHNRATGQTRRWRFQGSSWVETELPRDRHEVAVTAKDLYDVQALLARMRAVQLRDRSAIRTLESRMESELHIQSERGLGGVLGFTFRSFRQIDEQEELLQKQVRFNGVKANLHGEIQLPIIESRSSLAVPVALGLTENYRYSDEGAEGVGRRRIRFTPVDSDSLYYEGVLLVDETTGRVLEERSSRSGLPGIVKSERRVITYGEPIPGFWWAMKVDTQERWVLPGGVSQVRRIFTYSEFEINGQGFEAHRQEARGSSDTMLKQTVDGLRYFTRQGDGTRKLEEKSKMSGQGLGGGLYLDPNMTPPALPIAGLAYMNFNALGKGIQVSALVAAVFNMASLTVPNIKGSGVDASARASVMLYPTAQRVVRRGVLVEGEAVDRSGGTVRITLGRDLGLGFRLEGSGDFIYDHFRHTQDEDHETPGFEIPESGWQRGWEGSLGWQFRGFQLRGFYGKSTRPESIYGTSQDPQVTPDGGHSSSWGGVASMDYRLENRWQIHGELGHEAGKGFDRFRELSDDSNSVGVKALPVSDRLDFAQVSVALPPVPSLRLSLALNHARLRAVDDLKTYRFTGLTLSGDLPGFWWFTTVRADLRVGLQSDIPGTRGVSGFLMFTRMF